MEPLLFIALMANVLAWICYRIDRKGEQYIRDYYKGELDRTRDAYYNLMCRGAS